MGESIWTSDVWQNQNFINIQQNDQKARVFRRSYRLAAEQGARWPHRLVNWRLTKELGGFCHCVCLLGRQTASFRHSNIQNPEAEWTYLDEFCFPHKIGNCNISWKVGQLVYLQAQRSKTRQNRTACCLCLYPPFVFHNLHECMHILEDFSTDMSLFFLEVGTNRFF